MRAAIGTAIWSLSWRSRYLLTGDPRAWCAAAYDRIDHHPRHLAFVCVMDMAFGTNHCAYSWAWWGCYEKKIAQTEKPVAKALTAMNSHSQAGTSTLLNSHMSSSSR